MYDVLIFLLNRDFEEEVVQLFSDPKFRPYLAYEMEDVVKSCQQELFDLALIWPATYDETTDFLTVLNINYFNFIPVIAVIDDPSQLSKVQSLPLVDYISLPLPRYEFYHILNEVLEDVDIHSAHLEGLIWQGILEEYNLIDLIQMIESGRQDAVLTLRYIDKVGHVLFKDGDIIHAQFMGLTGLKALKRLVFWPRGNFEIKFTKPKFEGEQISHASQEILMELLQHLSEVQKTLRELPDLFEEVMTNPFVSEDQISNLQKKIINILNTPMSIFNVILLLEEDELQVMQAIRTLLANGYIGSKSEIEAKILEEERKSSLSKIISSFSMLFKKKTHQPTSLSPLEPTELNLLEPQLEIVPTALSPEDRQQIQQKLEAL